jgi:hypothetical protein
VGRKSQGSSEVVENEAARHATILVRIFSFDSSGHAHRLWRCWFTYTSAHAYAKPHAHTNANSDTNANTGSELGAAHNIHGRRES